MFDELMFWPFSMFVMGSTFILGILLFAFWIWMIIDAATRKFKNDLEKIVWIIVILITSGMGALVYFIAIKTLNPKGIAKENRIQIKKKKSKS